MNRIFLSALISAVLGTASARAEPVSWSKEVFPVLQKHCLGCHSDLSQKGGLNMERRDTLLKGGAKKGPAFIAGKPKESPLAFLIDGSTEPKMPPKGKMVPPAQVEMIKRWISEGAKFDAEGTLELEKPNWITIDRTEVFAVALTGDGKRIAIGRGNKVEVWDVDAAKRLTVLTGARDIVQSLAFSPDGAKLLAGEFEQILIWNTADWKPAGVLGGHADRVTAMAFTKDGKTLVAASGMPVKSGFIHVWNMADGKETRRVEAHSDCIYGLALSADGKWVATASADKLAKIHEVETGKLVKQFAGHTHHVLGVGISADNKTLFTGGADNEIKVWDIEKGEKTKDGKGHTRQVTGLLMRPDGKSFYTCSGDKTIREWNPGGNPTKSLGTLGDYVYCLGLSADGARLAAGGQDGTVRVFTAADGKVLKEFTRTTPADPPATPAPAETKPEKKPKK